MVMRFMFLKNLFEAEMLEKNKASSSKKQIVKKELIKLLDLVRISMQNEEENFTEFYLSKIFENVKDSKSLNFHNFLIELAQICELPDEIHDICKENLEALKRKPTTKIGPIAKIPENVLSFIQNNNLNQNDQNSTEKTMSTLMTEGNFN